MGVERIVRLTRWPLHPLLPMLTKSEVLLVAEDDSLPVCRCPMLVTMSECETAADIVFVENVFFSFNSAVQSGFIEATAYSTRSDIHI